ncbi:MAG: Sec-independent protein translocase protein TatB [Pseudomonadota bacterium]
MSLVPQFGFPELILVAVIALIVVGPKDLPKLMRSAGSVVRKAREMAAEFTNAFDQMAREAEMEDLRAEIEDLKKNNPLAEAKRELDEAVKPIDSVMRDAADELNAEGREAAAAVNKPVDKVADDPQEPAEERSGVREAP